RVANYRARYTAELTRNKEFELMCPRNRVGAVDVLLGLHHGQDTSNSEVLVHALQPRVAIMNNGTRKGGGPEVMKIIHTSPGLEDLWQMHFSGLSGQEYTVPGRVHSKRCGRAAEHNADRANPFAAANRQCASTTSPQWARLLDQGICSRRW